MNVDQATLANALIGRARDVAEQNDIQTALLAVTTTVVELGVADFASIAEQTSNGFDTVAPTTDRVDVVDQLQYQLGQGPCVQASYEDGVLTSNDVGDDPRWPEWGPRAAASGIHAVISVHLYTAGSAIGALNLYRGSKQNYTTDDLDIARLAGAHASTVMAYHRNDVNLSLAIEARHLIGQAQGILMERFAIDSDQAFALMRRISQDNNIKLHRIADHIVTTGELPDGASEPVLVQSDSDAGAQQTTSGDDGPPAGSAAASRAGDDSTARPATADS